MATTARRLFADGGVSIGHRELACPWLVLQRRWHGAGRRLFTSAQVIVERSALSRPGQKKLDRCAPTATPMPELCRRHHIGFSSGPKMVVTTGELR